MILTLDHVQRLNLHALMGAQKASVDEMRALWRMQDRIDLSAEEKEAINYRVVEQNGNLIPVWDPGKRLPASEYEFNTEEVARIDRIIKNWQPGFVAAADRAWLEPLLCQIETTPNGSH
jgi:hypothetical protein